MATQPSLVGRVITAGQVGAPIRTKRDGERPHKERQPAELTVYLNVDLMEQQKDDTFESASALKPGKSYYLFFNASNKSSNPASLSEKPLTISSNIELVLECKDEGNDALNILIENPKRIMTYQQIALRDAVLKDKDYEPFRLTVPPDCPEGMTTFRLYHIVTEGRYKSKKVSTILQIKVDSPYTRYEKALKQCHFDITKPYPEHTAFLYVMEANSNTLHMTYGYKGEVFGLLKPNWQPKVFDVSTNSWQPIRLADLAERAKSSYMEKAQSSQDSTSEIIEEVVEEIRKIMRDFSSQGPEEFLTWLHDLCSKAKGPLGLIIVDETDLEIPWEMLELKDEVYLGTVAAIARWSKVQLYTHRPLEVHDVLYQGSVIAYLNDHETGAQQAFAERKTLTDMCGPPFSMLHQLVDKISIPDALKQVGLIYLGCHGNTGVVYGSGASDRVTYIDLQNPIVHDDPRPIVFVNACNSARLKHTDGLRSVFLGRFASGYIGTLGEVISIYASKIADCLFQEALAEEGGIKVAEILRQLRAEVVAMTAKQQSIREAMKKPGMIALYEHSDLAQLSESAEKNLYFLTTFMYVYYGNPLARLHLTRKLEVDGREA